MTAVKLLAVSGSVRDGSFNQRLLDRASAVASEAGAEVTRIRLADLNLPLYTPALEAAGMPERALHLKSLFQANDGFLIATPEHNGSVSAILKNAIDWVSRPTDGETALALSAFRGKIAGLMSASPSPFGGLRSVTHLRQILATVQVLTATEQVIVPFADSAFEGDELVAPIPNQLLPILVSRVMALCRASS